MEYGITVLTGWLTDKGMELIEQDNKKWELKDFAPHQHTDVWRRNENIDAGKPLCPECQGTGNMFFSMYKKCDVCNGTGVKAGG
jgi:RecJ-like exonuclease